MNKILTSTGLAELITKIKATFIPKTDTIEASTLDIDATPTASSTNLVTSGGVAAAISGKQDTIDSSHKLSADLVNDATTTNKFVTSAEKSLINSALQSHQTITLASGTNNGTLKITTAAGTTDNVAVTGLGSAAYTESNAYANAAQGATADAALPKSWVNNTVSSTSTSEALSANQGKLLNDRITNLSTLGRFLSVWNCTTGLPNTDPEDNPYTYKTGDYFIVGTVGTTNYKPSGTSYTRTASTAVETGTVSVNDTYYYDNNTWTLLHTVVPTVSFSSLAGDPYDNANMTTALNDKAASDHTHNYVNIQTLPSGADLNDYTTSSIWYNVSTATISTFLHKPDGAPGGECMLEIRELGSSRYVYQQYTAKGGSDYQNYGRVCNNGTWGRWKKVAWTAEIPDVSGKEDTANKVTSDIGISSSSTDTQYPSAKAVYNAIQGSITDSIGGSY